LGTDVLVTGTGFLGAPNVGTLLAAADVDVALSQSDLAEILAANSSTNDSAFDTLLNNLESSGMDRLVLDVGQVEALGADGLTIDAGTDVLITGTGFLGSPGVGTLLAAADVDVALSQSNLNEILAANSSTNDAAFDTLLNDLQDSGMDRLVLDVGQVEALGADGLTIDAGTDVLITGTSFLGSPGVNTLLAAADVDVSLSESDLSWILAAGSATAVDARLDSLISSLSAAGMDRLVLDPGQVEALAAVGSVVDFESGDYSVLVTGTSFLGSTNVNTLLANVDVDVRLSTTDLTQLLTAGAGSAALGNLETALNALDGTSSPGDVRLDLDLGAVKALATAGFDFSSNADVVVTGTGFLSTTGSQQTELLDDAKLTVALDTGDADYLASFTTADSLDAALSGLQSRLDTFNTDTLEFSSGDLGALVDSLASSFSSTELASLDGFGLPTELSAISVTGTGFLDNPTDPQHDVLDKLFDDYNAPGNADGVHLDEQIVKLLGGS
jgi:hypothetical protein